MDLSWNKEQHKENRDVMISLVPDIWITAHISDLTGIEKKGLCSLKTPEWVTALSVCFSPTHSKEKDDGKQLYRFFLS